MIAKSFPTFNRQDAQKISQGFPSPKNFSRAAPNFNRIMIVNKRGLWSASFITLPCKVGDHERQQLLLRAYSPVASSPFSRTARSQGTATPEKRLIAEKEKETCKFWPFCYCDRSSLRNCKNYSASYRGLDREGRNSQIVMRGRAKSGLALLPRLHCAGTNRHPASQTRGRRDWTKVGDSSGKKRGHKLLRTGIQLGWMGRHQRRRWRRRQWRDH